MTFDNYTDDEIEVPIEFVDNEVLVERKPNDFEFNNSRIGDEKINTLLEFGKRGKEEAKLKKNMLKFLEAERHAYDLEIELKKKTEEFKHNERSLIDLEAEAENQEEKIDFVRVDDMNINEECQGFEKTTGWIANINSPPIEKPDDHHVSELNEDDEVYLFQKIRSLPRLSVKAEKTENDPVADYYGSMDSVKGDNLSLDPNRKVVPKPSFTGQLAVLIEQDERKKRPKNRKKRNPATEIQNVTKNSHGMSDVRNNSSVIAFNRVERYDDIIFSLVQDERRDAEDEIHQKLLNLSSEQYQIDLRELRKVKRKKEKTNFPSEMPRYTSGVELPNSAALPEILPPNYRNNVLNRSEKLFQRDSLMDMYRRPSKPLVESSNPSQRKVFKSNRQRIVDDEEEYSNKSFYQYDGSLSEEDSPAEGRQSFTVETSTGEEVLPHEEIVDQKSWSVLLDQDPVGFETQEHDKKKVKRKKKKQAQQKSIRTMIPLVQKLREKAATDIAIQSTLPAPPFISLGDKVTKIILKTHGLEKEKAEMEGRPNMIPVKQAENLKKKLSNILMKVPDKQSKCLVQPLKRVEMSKAPTVKNDNQFEPSSLAGPILRVLGTGLEKIEAPVTIEKISYALISELQANDPQQVKDAVAAIISLYRMFVGDFKAEHKFDIFIAPLLDAYENESSIIRHIILQAIVNIGIQHDNFLLVLITALADKNLEVRRTAIQGLAQFGIADKEGLKRAMVWLDMIKGVSNKNSNEVLEVS
jgi:hypothetical protein